MNKVPFVSVIMPCLNEANYIRQCLDSVIGQDYPKNRLEILIVDGMSHDGSRDILLEYSDTHQFIKLIDNHKKSTPAALNTGINHAKGEIIVRMDAHSTYESEYISKCVRYLKESNADNVGGIWVTVPRDKSLLAKSISFSLSHVFGVGNAHYRIGQSKTARFVDTVPFGCFRKNIFTKIGYFNEAYPRNEDIEFNARLRKAGGKILLVPEIVINYYARSTFREFYKHNFDNGLKVTNPLILDKMFFSWRHLVPFIFVSLLIGLLILTGILRLSGNSGLVTLFSLWAFIIIAGTYTISNLFFSFKIAIKEKRFIYFLLMPIIFITLHVSYGLGSIWGILTLLGSHQFWIDKVRTRNVSS